MKTLAELKRDAKSGTISGEMVYRFGEEIPARLQGTRKIVDANTVCIKFLNADGNVSELRIKAASLVEYTGEMLTIFKPGEREMNSEEKAFMRKWEAIAETEDYKNRSINDALSDGNSTYYQKKRFFTDGGFEYLLGYDRLQGKKYIFGSGLVSDNAVKGDIELQYKITKTV